MKAHCPKCGSSAKFISQKPHTINFAEALFRCDDPKCGADVLAEVTFSMQKTPAGQCFSGKADTPSDRVKTDC